MNLCHFACSASLLLATASCVPTSKYQEAQQANRDCANRVDALKVQIDQLKQNNSQLHSDLSALSSAKNNLEQDTALAGVKNRVLHNQLAVLENDLRLLATKIGDVPEYSELMKHLNQMQDALATSEDQRLDSEKSLEEQKHRLAEANSALAESERQLQQSTEELDSKSKQLKSQQAELASAQQNIARQAQQLRDMEAQLKAKDNAMSQLKTRIANALVDFNSDELTVVHKDGKVYVSLEEKLLFASGQYEVNAKGLSAIRKIAAVLKDIDSDINIDVEGHTDNIPLHGTVILDNWDLSAKRATSVLRVLISGGVPATRVHAVGCADTNPVASNDSEAGRCKNRRTEIVLSPKIESILENL